MTIQTETMMKMSDSAKIVLIIGLAAIIYYGYTKIEEFKQKIEDKLEFIT